MSETLPALPLEWVKRVFSRMAAVYGNQFSAKWGSENMDEVLQVWADELRNFRDHPSAIKYALLHLPEDFPPNLQQFKSICREGLKRETKPLALEHKMSEVDMQAGRAKVAELVQQVHAPLNHRQWIYSLKLKAKSFEPTHAVSKMLQEAEFIERSEHPETYAEYAQ